MKHPRARLVAGVTSVVVMGAALSQPQEAPIRIRIFTTKLTKLTKKKRKMMQEKEAALFYHLSPLLREFRELRGGYSSFSTPAAPERSTAHLVPNVAEIE